MKYSHFSPPTDFLLACLRSRFDPAALADAAALAAQPEFAWEHVLAAADEESVAPLLYNLLRGLPWLPAAVETQLYLAYIDSAARNTLIFHELGGLLALLERAGIPVIVFKGAALAEALYGDVALRPMSDIDLLVEWKHIPVALDLMQAVGYEIPIKEVAAGATLTYGNEIMLIKPGNLELAVDLHWNLLSLRQHQRTLDMAWFWTTRRPATIAGFAASALGPEAQLLHLCAHLLKHRMERMLWQMDIVALLHSLPGQLDWDLLLSRAAAVELVLSTRQVLTELARQWRAPVPEDVLLRLTALQPTSAEIRLVAWQMAGPHPAQALWAGLVSLSTWQARLNYAWINLFPSATYMRWRYTRVKSWPLPICYVYRWYRGARGLMAARFRRTVQAFSL